MCARAAVREADMRVIKPVVVCVCVCVVRFQDFLIPLLSSHIIANLFISPSAHRRPVSTQGQVKLVQDYQQVNNDSCVRARVCAVWYARFISERRLVTATEQRKSFL